MKHSSQVKLEPFPASVVRSVAAAPSHASITMVTVTPACSSSNIAHEGGTITQQQTPTTTADHQERASRYFSITQSKGDPGHPKLRPNSSEQQLGGLPSPAPSSGTLRRYQAEAEEHDKEEAHPSRRAFGDTQEQSAEGGEGQEGKSHHLGEEAAGDGGSVSQERLSGRRLVW